MSKPMIYVAHPYSGKDANKQSVDTIMRELIAKDDSRIYFSPIHNFGMLYFEKRYEKGLDICLDALDKCNALVLCGDWRHSKGCIGEYAFAKGRGISIYELKQWKGKLNATPKHNEEMVE